MDTAPKSLRIVDGAAPPQPALLIPASEAIKDGMDFSFSASPRAAGEIRILDSESERIVGRGAPSLVAFHAGIALSEGRLLMKQNRNCVVATRQSDSTLS